MDKMVHLDWSAKLEPGKIYYLENRRKKLNVQYIFSADGPKGMIGDIGNQGPPGLPGLGKKIWIIIFYICPLGPFPLLMEFFSKLLLRPGPRSSKNAYLRVKNVF